MNDFYVGYLPQAPRDLSGFITRTVVWAVALGLVVAAVLVFAQQPFASSRFEIAAMRIFA